MPKIGYMWPPYYLNLPVLICPHSLLGSHDLLSLELGTYTLYGSQNGLSVQLQASYTLSSGPNGLSKLLQVSYMLGGGENRLSELLQPFYMLISCWVEMDSPNFARRTYWKTIIVQTSDGFCACTQKRSHGDLICHSCGSDFVLLPLIKKCVILINTHHNEQHFCSWLRNRGTKWLSQVLHIT